MKTSKRILSVVVKRMADYDVDTSYLGEYSDTAEEYSIVAYGQHEGEFVADLPCECGHAESDHDDTNEQVCVPDCDCQDFDRVGIERGRNFRYFNTAETDSDLTAEEIRTYAQQNFKRMQGLNNNDWCYLGVQAEAQVQTNGFSAIQTISSEQLAELKLELRAIGFSTRAIATAFKSVEHATA